LLKAIECLHIQCVRIVFGAWHARKSLPSRRAENRA
jgi:hypothetical protein